VEQHDPYEGVKMMMPYAKAISAKTMGFDQEGNDIRTDYYRMLKIVKEAGYEGYIGIEYSGDQLSEEDGIKMTKVLMDRVAKTL